MPEEVGPQSRFGAAVAVSDAYRIVGASGHHDSGAVFVFGVRGLMLRPSAVIVPFQGAPGDGFGSALDLEGDLILVGAPVSEIDGVLGGRGFVYRHDNAQGIWIQEDDLLARSPSDLDYFGTAVALSGDLAVVGSPGDDERGSNTGAAFVFSRDPSGWSSVAKLMSPDAAEGDRFGESVGIRGSRIIVGSPFGFGPDSRTGSAYLFTAAGDSIKLDQRLLPASDDSDQGFGKAVALTDGHAIVGAPGPGNTEAPGGSVSIFVLDEDMSAPEQVLTSGPSAVDEGFGASLDGHSGFLIVGSQRLVGDHPGPGSAHVFELNDGSWNHLETLAGSEASKADGYGGSVSISAKHAAVGAPGDASAGPYSGAVYFYTAGPRGWR